MSRIFTRLGFTAAAIVAGSGIVAHAQTVTTGAVTGVVTDKSGAPVAGATVKITSSQTSRTAVTGADGSYRFGLLNPGAWTLEVSKAGNQKVTQPINVSVNQTNPTNVKMASEAAAVVEVLGVSSTVDVTSAQTGANFNLESMSAIPKGRDFNAMILMAPGTVDGNPNNFANDGKATYSISGASGIENSFVVDGLNTTDSRKGYQGSAMPTDFIDQAEIQTGGLKPEYNALGGVVNAVTKSGSNNFQGSAWVTIDARGSQAVPKQNTFYQQAPPMSRNDIGFTVGGAILKDKLFYFVGADITKREDAGAATSTNNLGYTSSIRKIDTTNIYAKLNWFITPDHQLTLATNIQREKDGQDVRYSNNNIANIALKTKSDTDNYTLNYDWAISGNQTLTVKLGHAAFSNPQVPQGATDITQNGDQAAGYGSNWGVAMGVTPGASLFYGGAGQYTTENELSSDQFKIDYSIFLGNHMLKVGYSNNSATYNKKTIQSGGGITWQLNAYISGNAYPIGTPTTLVGTYYNNDGKVTADYLGYYLQDTWEMAPGLRVIYGGRVDTAKVKNFSGLTVMDFHDFKDQFQPRIALTWDVNNDGKSKVTFGYAKMVEMPPMEGVMRQGGSEVFYRRTWDNPVVTPGSSNTFTYNGATGAFTTTGAGAYRDLSSAFTLPVTADGTKLNTRVEWVAGFDQALPNNWSVGVHAKYRYLTDAMEDTVLGYGDGRSVDPGLIDTTPGEDGIKNGGPGGYITPDNGGGYAILWNPGKDASYISPITGERITVGNLPFPTLKNNYMSLDVTADHRTAHDYFAFSYTLSRQEGNYEGMGQTSNGQDEANITSTWDYLPYVGWGLLPLDVTNVLKIQASHTFDVGPGQLSFGTNWTYRSGSPLTKFDDGSLTSNNAPGFDSANAIYLSSGRMIVPNGGLAAMTGRAGWDPATNIYSGSLSGLPYHQYLDYGHYFNAVPNSGNYGQDGRTPAYNKVDLNISYSWMATKRVKLTPTVDVFNVFNTRVATAVEMRALVAGGGNRLQYGAERAWLTGRSYRFGFKVQF